MNEDLLKERIVHTLWEVVDTFDCIQSATLTGSFVHSKSLEGLSDIDLVLVVDELDLLRFQELQRSFASSLEPVLNDAGYRLRINPTLGPLKFNEPKLAVLHLMLYSQQAHVEHVINSPFTCLDWQKSVVFRKQSLADIYPAFGLQPRHFLSARRSISDYLADFRASEVSFRELIFSETGYSEKKCAKPMTNRDRHEFAYHVMRFLMLNLLKLTRCPMEANIKLNELMNRFFVLFPLGESDARPLLMQLAEKKRRLDFDESVENLGPKLEAFIGQFEMQFREDFITNASRHLAFRHAPTSGNIGPTRFLGRSDLEILEPVDGTNEKGWSETRIAVENLNAGAAFVSPLKRCRRSLERVLREETTVSVDDRLIEMDYGQCEMMTVTDSRVRFPHLFESWGRSEDPRFPDGENAADVHERAWAFAKDHWKSDAANSVTCTHNVVLRCLIGEALGVPISERYRIQVPHLAPIEFVSTKRFGVVLNLSENVERRLFRGFVYSALEPTPVA